MSEKQKLTLSVNKDVVDKAKELGINISDITENVLRGFAFTPKELNDDELYKQYQELFNVMLPLMQKYNFNVKIGSDTIMSNKGYPMGYLDIYFEPNGMFWDNLSEDYYGNIKMTKVYQFRSPVNILSNFIEELTNSVEKRKEEMKELEMAKRIIEAISGTILLSEKDTNFKPSWVKDNEDTGSTK